MALLPLPFNNFSDSAPILTIIWSILCFTSDSIPVSFYAHVSLNDDADGVATFFY